MSMPQDGGSREAQGTDAGFVPETRPAADASIPQDQQYQQGQYGPPQNGQAQNAQAQNAQAPYAQAPYAQAQDSQQPTSSGVEAATRVTGKRVVQYIIDNIIVFAVSSGIFFGLGNEHSSNGNVHIHAGAGAVGLVVVWWLLYWVALPKLTGGKTLGMMMLGLQIVRMDGGKPGVGQLLVRAILLIIDGILAGLVGFITILSSRYRQRIGDHAAKTLVIGTRGTPEQAAQQLVDAGQAGRQ
jgi:uncharacterized RDD family membrane protein YckC